MRNMMRGTLAVLLLAAGTGSAKEKLPPVDVSKVRLVEGHAELTKSGFIKIAGELHNDTGVWIRGPQIDVELFDDKGQPLGVKSIATAAKQDKGSSNRQDGALSARYLVPPGEVAVFEYLREAKKVKGGTYSKHKLTLRARPTRHQVTTAIEGFNATQGPDGAYTVSGTLKNTSQADCRTPTAVLGLYMADGKLYRVKTVTPKEYFQKMLKPGASVAFNLKSLDNPGNAVADIKAWGDCQFLTE